MYEIINYTDKSISEFNPDDTFYGVKTAGDYRFTFFLEFIKFEKGMLTGRVCGKIQPNNYSSLWIGKEHIRLGSEMSFRITKCYTWSEKGCHWFEKENNKYKCKKK
jgi:hypothetical protein